MEIKKRGSAMDLFAKCAMSDTPEDGAILVKPTSEAADLGSAVHNCIAAYLENAGAENTPFEPICRAWGVAWADASPLVFTAIRLWNQGNKNLPPLKEIFGPVFAVEKHLVANYSPRTDGPEQGPHSLRISCTLDLVAIGIGIASDWKSGFLDRSNEHQVMAYSLALMTEHDLEQVVFLTMYLRTGIYEKRTVTIAQATAWADSVITRAINGQGVYSPGDHCGFCAKATTCPGRRAYMDSAAADLLPLMVDGEKRLPIAREKLPAFVRYLTQIEATCKVAREMVREDLRQFGPIPLADGREYGLVEQAAPSRINGSAALPVVLNMLGAPSLPFVVSFSKTTLIDYVREQAQRGQKQAAEESMLRALRSAKAIEEPRHFVAKEYTPKESKEITNGSAGNTNNA